MSDTPTPPAEPAPTTLEDEFMALRDRLRADGHSADEIAVAALALAVSLMDAGEQDWFTWFTTPVDVQTRQMQNAVKAVQLAGQAMAAASSPGVAAGILGCVARKHREAVVPQTSEDVQKALAPIDERVKSFCSSMYDEGYSAWAIGPVMAARGGRLILDSWGPARAAEYLQGLANTAVLQGPAAGQA